MSSLALWMAPRFENTKNTEVIAMGDVLTYGAATGKVVFNRKDAIKAIHKKQKTVLVLSKVEGEDLELFRELNGLILINSGPTTHAAVVAKGLGLPTINVDKNLFKNFENEQISIDANTGAIYKGELKIQKNTAKEELVETLGMFSKDLELEIYTNAETFHEAKIAKIYGAKGIGLCRTEHMFLREESLKLIREILFSNDYDDTVIKQLIDIQMKDFKKLFEVFPNDEIVIRFLDAPLHEFAKHEDTLKQFENVRETNPMLGFRGARMLLAKPVLIELQTKAILTAISKIEPKKRPKIIFEIPMVIDEREVELFILEIKQKIEETKIKDFDYGFGAMLETPRAVFTAGRIAKLVDTLSFGTNDLTQNFLALSRDDSSNIIRDYRYKVILDNNPFEGLDDMVLNFIKKAVKKARQANPHVKISVCGEQAADPSTITKLMNMQINYISVSPARIPQASLSIAKRSSIK